MKQSGLGDQLYIDGYDIGCDIGSLGRIGGGPAALDVTGICKSAFQRVGGVRDGGIEFSAYFNPERATDDPGVSEDRAHVVLSTLPSANRIVTYVRGAQAGGQAACLVSKQINYDPTRAQDGALTLAISAQGNGYGLEWCRQLTPGKRADTGATDGASVAYPSGTNFGLQAYLQVFSFTGADATVTIEHSADDGVADPWTAIPGSQFGAITSAPQALRSAEFGMTIERYLRVVTSGTFTELEFAVLAAVNQTEVKF